MVRYLIGTRAAKEAPSVFKCETTERLVLIISLSQRSNGPNMISRVKTFEAHPQVINNSSAQDPESMIPPLSISLSTISPRFLIFGHLEMRQK